MTLTMETLDGGKINTGFFWEKSKIELGNLPLMSTQQLVGYAALTLTQEIIPKLNAEDREKWSAKVHATHEKLETLPTRNPSGKYFAMSPNELYNKLPAASEDEEIEIGDALLAAISSPMPAEYYAENPFLVQEDGHRVGFVYDGELQHVVDANDFFILAHFVMSGGWRGWSKYGTYQEVKDAAKEIDAALSDPVIDMIDL